MDIQLLQHGQIDKIKWDKIVAGSPREMPYFYSWYLDALHPGWKALVTEDYQWVFPLPVNKSLGFWKQMIQPLFIQQLGLIGFKKPDSATINSFMEKIPSGLAQLQVSFMEELHIDQQSKFAKFQTKGINQLLPLRRQDQELFEGFSKSVRRNIRKNEEKFSELIPLSDPQQVVQLYKKEINHMAALKDQDYNRLRLALSEGLKKKRVLLFELRTQDGKPAARAAYLLGKNRIINLVSTSDKKFKKWSPQTIMIHKVIKKYCMDYDFFDFEGSSIPGINSFFASFGSKEIYYPKIHWKHPLLKLIHKAKVHLGT